PSRYPAPPSSSPSSPPRSTLFPYTTLFRSHRRAWFSFPLTGVTCLPAPFSDGLAEGLVFGLVPSLEKLSWREPDPLARRKKSARDRKSTRLNSSHVSISYAVFCLKKKKNST